MLDGYHKRAAFARAGGMVDAVDSVPDWRPRVDALYAVANAIYDTDGAQWWHEPCFMGMLADGRMAIVGRDFGIVEPKEVA